MEPYQLADDQAGAAGAVIAAAFLPSAVARYFVPNPERRGRILPVFFTTMTRLAIRHGHATAVGSPPLAVALWIAPGEEPDDADYAAAGMLEADALMDAGERDRLAALD